MTAGAAAISAGTFALAAQSDKPIRLAIIGTGYRAWAHLAILKAIESGDINLAMEHLSSHIRRVKSLLLQAHHEK